MDKLLIVGVGGAVVAGVLVMVQPRARGNAQAPLQPPVSIPAQEAKAYEAVFADPASRRRIDEPRQEVASLLTGPSGTSGEPSAARVSMCLVTPHGKSVAGLSVAWTSDDGESGRAPIDGAGRVEMSVPSETPFDISIPSAAWTVGQLSTAVLAPGERRDLGTVVLTPAQILTGLVVDADGAGCAGAMVRIGSNRSVLDVLGLEARLGQPKERLVEVRTDASGAFAVEGLLPGSYRVDASCEGFVPLRRQAWRLPAADGKPLRLVLESGRSVQGRVLTQSDAPLAGAEIVIVPADESRDLVGMMTAPAAANSDAFGDFELRGLLRTDATRLIVRAAGFAPQSIWTRPGEGAVELRLRQAGQLTGQVLEPTGRPVPGAKVHAHVWSPSRLDELPYPSVESDAEGRFRLEGLEPRAYRLTATGANGRGALGPVSVEAGANRALELVLSGTRSLTVSVVDDEGRAVSGARVRLGVPVNESAGAIEAASDPTIFALSDDRGEARFHDVPEGPRTVQASVEFAGAPTGLKSSVEKRIELLDEQPIAMSLSVRGVGSLSLQVLASDGSPVPKATVRLTCLEESAANAWSTQRADAFGLVSWTGLPAGRYEARWSPDARFTADLSQVSGPAEYSRAIIEIEPGYQSVARLTLFVETALHVRVERDGKPVAGAFVGLQRAGEPMVLAAKMLDASVAPRTNGRGETVLVAPRAGAYELFARSRLSEPVRVERIELLHSTERCTLRLGTAKVTGHVSNAGGRSIPGVVVRLVPRDVAGSEVNLFTKLQKGVLAMRMGETLTETDAAGAFAFREVPAGDYRIELQGPEAQVWVGPWQSVEAYARIALDSITITRSASLVGRVDSVDGSLVQHADAMIMQVRSKDGERLGMSSVSPEGGYAIDGLVPGEYELRLSWADRVKSLDVHLDPGTNFAPAIRIE